jgi:hypothetical protein
LENGMPVDGSCPLHALRSAKIFDSAGQNRLFENARESPTTAAEEAPAQYFSVREG